jgi:hypothetical protein
MQEICSRMYIVLSFITRLEIASLFKCDETFIHKRGVIFLHMVGSNYKNSKGLFCFYGAHTLLSCVVRSGSNEEEALQTHLG